MNNNENNNETNNLSNLNVGSIHNLELTLKNEDNENEIDWGFEFGKIFRRFKSKKRLFLRIVTLFLVIGFIAGICIPFTQNSKTVKSGIMFKYDGIEKGLAPDGSQLDISKIKSHDVVDKALKNAGIADVDADAVSKRISISGIVPQNIIDKITTINRIAETKPEAARELLDIEYTSTQYILEFNFDSMNISKKKACQILNAVMEEYRKYFHNAYFNEKFLEASVNIFDYGEYDYAEALNILEMQTDSILDYLDKMLMETNNFRSPSGNYNYTDLKAAVKVIKDIDIAKIYSTVYTYNISQDRNKLSMYYNYLIEQETRNLNEAIEKKQAVQAAIDTYQKDPLIIAGSEEQSAQIADLSVAGEIYDELIEQNIQAAAKVAEISKEIERYRTRINTINHSGSSKTQEFTQEEYEGAKVLADADIKSAAEKLNKYIQDIDVITKEYYDSKNYDESYRVIAPATYDGMSIVAVALSGITYGVIGAAVGFVLMLIYQTLAVYIPLDIFFEENGNKNKTKKESKKNK